MWHHRSCELFTWYTIEAKFTGDPLHSRAACTQPCNVNTHSRAHCSPGARLCEQWGHGCVNNRAWLCASARLCRGSPVNFPLMMLQWRPTYGVTLKTESCHDAAFVESNDTGDCHKDSLRSHQWRHSWHRENSSFQCNCTLCWHGCSWWRRAMEMLSMLSSLCEGNPQVTAE